MLLLPVPSLVAEPDTPSIVLETVNERDLDPTNCAGTGSSDGFVTVTVPLPTPKLRLDPLYELVRSEVSAQKAAPIANAKAIITFQLIFISNYSILCLPRP